MKRQTFLLILAVLVLAGGMASHAQTNITAVRLDKDTSDLLRDAVQDKWFKKDNFVSALLGGALAIAGGLAASWYAHSLQIKHIKQKDAEFAANVLRAIRRELEALGEIYDKGIGQQLAKSVDGQPLL